MGKARFGEGFRADFVTARTRLDERFAFASEAVFTDSFEDIARAFGTTASDTPLSFTNFLSRGDAFVADGLIASGTPVASALVEPPADTNFTIDAAQPIGDNAPAIPNAAFLPGNIVVYRVGIGASALNSSAAAVFLDEYTPAGVLVQSIPMPTADSGANQMLTASGTATSEGLLTRSADGRYLILTGYDAAPLTASVAATTAPSVQRVVGRVDAAGNIDTSTILGTAISGTNIRGAASIDGSAFWAVGGASGVAYASLGQTSSTIISSTFTNLRGIDIADGQLYVSASTTGLRLGAVGTGTPSSTGQTITNLAGFSTASGGTGASPYQFFFADLSALQPGVDTVYVADDRAVASGGGLQKWSLSGGTWSLIATLTTGLTTGLRGLEGSVSGTSVTFYATTTQASANSIVSVIDTSGYGAAFGAVSFTTVATAAPNTVFRGVAFAPTSSGSLSINDVTQAEGNSGTTNVTFTVTRSGGTSGAIGASWALTLSGAAVAGDFTAFPQSGTVAFADGETTTTITITVQGDFNNESDELFTVVLSTPTGGATISDDTGQGTITNDDPVIDGTPGPDTINGTVGDDVINGLAGIDTINANNGNDTASGGDDNDNVNGQNGDDTLYGDAGNDRVDGGADNDMVYGGLDHDRVIGGTGDDTLDGGDGDDMLNGDTTAAGGTGNDILIGGAGWDRAAFFTSTGGVGVTVDLNIVGIAQNTGQGMDTLSGIEHLSGTVFADTLTGDGGNNWLWGSTANFGGVDSGANNDIISGNGGDDHIEVGIGNHMLDGGADNDTLRFTESGNITEAGITVSLLLQGAAQATGYGSWTLSNFENLSGGQGGDTLTGDGNANRITGERGDDIIAGGGGNDILSGDLIYWVDTHGTGYSGQPTLMMATDSGGAADATGNDTLDGGTGEDTVLYRFLAGAGTLTIVADGLDYLVKRDGVDVARVSISGNTVTVTGLGDGAHIGTDTLTNIEHISFAIDGSPEVILDLAGQLSVDDVSLAEGNAGTTSFTFTVTRSGGTYGAVSATWTLSHDTSDNADFTAFPQSGTVSFADGETSQTITITVAGDIDVEGNDTFFVDLSAPTGGVTILDAQGQGTITNDDTASNSPPVGNADSYSVNEDQILTVNALAGVLANDSDSDNDPLTVTLGAGVTHGTLLLNNDGSFTYTPDANYNGPDSFTYNVSDGTASSGPITVSLTVDPVGEILPPGQLVPAGGEFLVNSFTGSDQIYSSVAALEGGGFVVTWSSNGQDGSNYGVYGQRYDAAGVAQGSEFRINTYTSSDQLYSSVAALEDGGFLVTWSSNGQDGSSYGVYGQRYDAAGVAQGSEFRVNTYTPNFQTYSSVAALDGGGFVVTWISGFQDGSGSGVYGQRYDAAGVAQGSEFRINTYTSIDQLYSSVAALEGGGFVVTWSSNGQDGSSYGIYGQRYDAAGVAQGSEFRVNTYTTSSQDSSSVAALDGGGFVVTWTSLGQDGSGWGIYGQRYTALGAADGVEFRVNTATTNNQFYSSVAALNGGGFVVTWSSFGQDGSSNGVYGQRYDAAGVADGAEFRLNETTNGSQFQDFFPRQGVAQLADGSLIATWQGNGAGDNVGIFARRFATQSNTAPVGNPDTYSVNEDSILNVNALAGVLANDTDSDNDPLTATLVTGPTNGTLVLNPNGSFTYTPNANFNGTDSFTYSASDGSASTDPVTVTLTVNSVNDAPFGADGSINFYEDNLLVLNDPLYFGFGDSDGNSFAGVWIDSYSGNGNFTLNGSALPTPTFVSAAQIASGELVFTPAPNANGSNYAEFTYRVVDDGGTLNGGSDTGTTNTRVINILAQNDAPVGVADAYTIDEDGVLTVGLATGVLANDTDVESSSLTASLVTGPAHGSLTLNADGSFTYTPTANYFGSDSFTYRASDGSAQSSPVTVTLTVNPVNDASTLSGFASTLAIVENAAPTLIDSDVSFGDLEGNFAGGTLSLSGLLAEDRAGIRNEGASAGQIGISGADVTYGGIIIGTFAGGIGSTLTVTFNANATSVAIDALIQNLTYANASDAPTATRTLTLNVVDSVGAALLNFAPFTTNPLGGVDVGVRSTPTFADYNGDGRIDLIVGNAAGNTIAVFQRQADGSFVQQIGAANPFNGITFNNLPAPAFADINGDGKIDALIAADSVTWRTFAGNGIGGFTELTGGANPFNGIAGNFDATPSFFDFDGDGDLDLVVGGYTGTFRAFQNTGNVFTELTGGANPFAGLSSGNHSKPAFVDIDGDGDSDLVSGNFNGTFSVFRNDGIGRPYVALTGVANPLNGLSVPVGFSAPTFGDLNGDGLLDLVSGDNDGTLIAFSQLPGRQIVVNVTPVNDAPVVDLNGANAGIDNSVAYTEGGGRVMLAPDVAVGDVDSATLTGATVTIASGFDSADSLRINVGASGIIANYNSSTGVLTLSGTASASAYQSVLATLSFKSGSDNPASTRDIIVTVTDGTNSSIAGHITIAVTPVNDAPVNFVPGEQSGTSGSPIIFSTGNGNALSVTDPDAGSSSIKVKIYVDHGTLTLSGTNGLTVRGNGSNVVVLQGSMADINAALNGLSYQPTTGYTGSDTLTIGTDDRGGNGTGGVLTDIDTVAITINPGVPTALTAPQIDLLDDGAGSNIAGAFIGKEHAEGPGGHLNIANHAFQTGPDLSALTVLLV